MTKAEAELLERGVWKALLAVAAFGAFYAAFFLSGCSAPRIDARPAARSLRLRVDTAFDARERPILGEAARRLAPVARVDLTFDLDARRFGERGTPTAGIVLRVPGDAPSVELLDARKNGRVLGYVDWGPFGPERCFIVADRLPDDRLLLSVGMHELGHMAGLEDGDRGVMRESASGAVELDEEGR